MKIEEIRAELDYHYRRAIGGKVEAGKGEVEHLHQVEGKGWYVHLQDSKTQRLLKLRPAHILRRVMVRLKKKAAPAR